MLDPKFVLTNIESVRENCRNRNVPIEVLKDLEDVVMLEGQRRELLRSAESVRRRQNEVAQLVGKEKNSAVRVELFTEGKKLKDELSNHQDRLRFCEAELKQKLGRIPNMTHPEAPIGRTEDESREIRRVGTPRTFGFPTRDHVEIGKALDLIDFESGGKVAGYGFYFLKNDAVLLDLALQQFAMTTLVRNEFIPIITPDLARNTILEGIGFNPRGAETQVYSVANSDLSLIGTAEITLGGMHADQVFAEDELPRLYAGISHCFRTEAGASGRASKGLYRVHQFTKVEMFAFTTPETSSAMHAMILGLEEQIFTELDIPYRVLDVCSGDLGGPAYRKFDIEAWMPGRGEAGEYGEVTSTSDCTDYQSRRLNIRYKPSEGKGTRLVHTLNGTAIALSRTLIAVLENYQRDDGLVDVPEVLWPYMGKKVIGN